MRIVGRLKGLKARTPYELATMPRPHTYPYQAMSHSTHTHTHTDSASIGRDYRNSNINLHTLHFIRARVIERGEGGVEGVGLSLVTTCNCHSQHPSPFSCPPSVMHSKADAVLIRRCGKSNLHTESQLANDLAIFGANCVAKRGGKGKRKGEGGRHICHANRRQKARNRQVQQRN